MIGIFGGTFDPVHYGHIKTALFVKQALNLSRLRFIPNRVPPHRETPWLPAEERLHLLQCALNDYDDIVIDERELNRHGPSYMVDTLKELKADLPGETLCLIIGMDAFLGINRWHEWRTIFDYCHVVVMTRPGFDLSGISKGMNTQDYRYIIDRITDDVSALSARECGKILLQSVPELDISSTMIRETLKNKKDISAWVPPAVCQQLMRNTNNDDR